mmetsp:Transcript_42442/g.125914  ORF Transcript_42442/g.125914 Transcript_42442/m.125914 type:complete len:203 (-) Transcript_42442:341-949(-)
MGVPSSASGLKGLTPNGAYAQAVRSGHTPGCHAFRGNTGAGPKLYKLTVVPPHAQRLPTAPPHSVLPHGAPRPIRGAAPPPAHQTSRPAAGALRSATSQAGSAIAGEVAGESGAPAGSRTRCEGRCGAEGRGGGPSGCGDFGATGVAALRHQAAPSSTGRSIEDAVARAREVSAWLGVSGAELGARECRSTASAVLQSETPS